MTSSSIFLDPEGRLRPFWRGILFVPAYLLLVLPLDSATLALSRAAGFRDTFEHSLFLFGLSGAIALLVAAKLFLQLLDRRPFGALGLWLYRGWWRELVLGMALGGLMLSVVVGVEMASGAVRFDWGGGTGQSLRALAWSFVLIAPAALKEELLLRGYPFQRAIEAIGAWPAIAVLSVIFGILHLWNPSATILSTANTALIGVVLALAYLKTRALWMPVGLHIAWNFFLGYLYSLPVSGIMLHYRLVGAKVSGPTYLTGGNYGPEGSAVTTVVIVAATVWLARSKKISVSEEMTEILK